MVGRDGTTYRPVRIIGLLLLLEAIGLVGIGVYEFAQVDWQLIHSENLSQSASRAISFLLFVLSAIVTVLSAMSFLLLRRRGWLLAAIAQGSILAVCLWLYSTLQPTYIYPVMVYSIVLALYLNSQDVRVVFHLGRGTGERKPGDIA